ncbi:glycoside hydrolase family 32 protein [Blautia schinkii]|nr:glycoside hydrolase family 32 protein [Blautia schinkii]
MNFEEKIIQATEKIYEVAEEKADKDPIRPEYHFHAPAQWMDDPNGVIWHKGYYHMMYSLNPDTDKYRAGMVYKTGSSLWKTSEPDWTGGITVWGHARSKDLIHWEHLPVALYPEIDKGEYYIWFGCTAINDEGVPVAIYTSIGYEDRNPTDSAIQHIWFGDDELLKWTPGTYVNPIMTEELHEGNKIWEWRDPFLFRQNGKAYLILGGKEDEEQGGRAAVLLYEAENKAFTKWKYKGVLFEYPDKNLRSCECPNIVEIGDKWVLLVSPHGPVEYFVGDLDAENCSFVWQTRGFVDRSSHYYATNVISDEKGRKLMWGAIEGFQNTSGWNGINSLPRELSLTEDGKLGQRIPDEFRSLRKGNSIKVSDSCILDSGTLELIISLDSGAGGKVKIGDNIIEIKNGAILAENHEIPVDLEREHRVHLFADKSVLEILIDNEEAFTAMLKPVIHDTVISCTGKGIELEVFELDTKDIYTKL